MLKQIPQRITYAQEKIIKLIQQRKLRQWCLENNLIHEHTILYRVSIGENSPTYKLISKMTHLIAPIEWLFYTDEKLPYTAQLLPQWNPKNECKFIKDNKHKYKEIAKKYNITELSAYNIVTLRAMPSLPFIRDCCKEINPINFFIADEITEITKPDVTLNIIPNRGDIINIQGKILLVLSKKEFSENNNSIICCLIEKKPSTLSIELINTKTKGYVNINNVQTFMIPRYQAIFIETLSEENTHIIMNKVKNIFE